MRDTLHKAVNKALRELAHDRCDFGFDRAYDETYTRLMCACPYKQSGHRNMWQCFASGMFRAGVDLINRGYGAP
jgi:hypothetical protein